MTELDKAIETITNLPSYKKNAEVGASELSGIVRRTEGGYLIEMGDGCCYWQREETNSASGTPLNVYERTIVRLCEHILGDA